MRISELDEIERAVLLGEATQTGGEKMFRKGLYERGIRFVVFTRDKIDKKRIERLLNCTFVRWLDE